MDTIPFEKLVLKTVFCCMAADGKIDKREIALIKSVHEKSSLFEKIDFQNEIDQLISEINANGKLFIRNYFNLLKQAQLSEQEELTLIDFAIQTINADEQVEYSEIKFFKNIRYRLKVSDEKILEHLPGIEDYLEEDIITDDFLDKITSQYFETTELPVFDIFRIDKNEDEE